MKKVAVLVLLMVILSACNSAKKENKTQSERIEVLETEVSLLFSHMTDLENQLGQSSISFTPGSTGYSALQTPMGNFIVSLEDLKKYANGYKATFLIGNPNDMTFSGLKLVIRWGKAYPNSETYSDWYNSLQTQAIDINKSIMPGLWNKVTVVLSPATATEVGTIMLSILPNGVSLGTDLRKDAN